MTIIHRPEKDAINTKQAEWRWFLGVSFLAYAGYEYRGHEAEQGRLGSHSQAPSAACTTTKADFQ